MELTMSPRPRHDADRSTATCPTCGNTYPVTEEYWHFYADARYSGGKRKSANCRSCESKRVNEWLAQKMADDPSFAERRRQKQAEATARRRAAKRKKT